MMMTGLDWLASADTVSLPASVLADCLRVLERAESIRLAATSAVLTAFRATAAYELDGQGSARTWLKWQTRISETAARTAMGWARRLADHPEVAGMLTAGDLSVSWAAAICVWSDKLPADHRRDADAILLAAAAGGAQLADLAALARQISERTAGPDDDPDGFEDRWLRVDQTLDGAGALAGQLTSRCRAALDAVLGTLSRRRGPEDTRSRAQRDHDALEEACRRLLAAGCLPERAGQPVQLQLHITLDQLLGLTGRPAEAPGARAPDAQPGGPPPHASQPAGASAYAWSGVTTPPVQGARAQARTSACPPAARNARPSGTSSGAAWFGVPAGPGDDCDAALLPIVTGHIDAAELDRLMTGWPGHAQASRVRLSAGTSVGDPATTDQQAQVPPPPDGQLRAERATRQLIVRQAAALLSGPAGLAAVLRSGLGQPLAGSVSLPLDIGAITETIPVHLRRALAVRDPFCRFPGCDQPAAACQPHHIVPRSRGGPTSLANLVNVCSFHHLTAIHRWGWSLTLLADGTTTAVSPDRERTLHSHAPPARAA
ncbi:MAG TPA: DUF222 domain-containing protein [Streptosporangiaceae bacterium]